MGWNQTLRLSEREGGRRLSIIGLATYNILQVYFMGHTAEKFKNSDINSLQSILKPL